MFKNVNKIIVVLPKLNKTSPEASLLTIYKSLIRPRLEYGGKLYKQTFSNSFHEASNSLNIMQKLQ